MQPKRKPGEVRDAIVAVLASTPAGASLPEIERRVTQRIGRAAASSIRSYLRLNTPELFARTARGCYALKENSLALAAGYPATQQEPAPTFQYGKSTLFCTDCFDWLRGRPEQSVHAVVTDPPYGLFEYTAEQQAKLRSGKGGVWRIPPSFDGVTRAPLPRFTVLSQKDLDALDEFFFAWARTLWAVLVPGANVIVASNPLLSYVVSGALARAGLERRGEIVRLVMTMRGGDRPKAAHQEFPGVSVMPRAKWEPWLMFRRPLEGRAQDNLRRWLTGGFRRPSAAKPFGDVIASSPTHKAERTVAPHPSLKPQGFLRQLVRGVLPLGKGIVLDPFAGSGSTLAAAESIGYESIGVEKDPHYFTIAKRAIPKLTAFRNGEQHRAVIRTRRASPDAG
ncbi:MAG: DNA-methyltransferase [Gemmatimonadaceae bacterium]